MPTDRAMRAAFRLLRFLRRCETPASASSAEGLHPGHRRVRSKKHRNARNAVVELGAQTYELGNLEVSQPVETDPSGARSRGEWRAATAHRRSCRLRRRKSPLFGATAASERKGSFGSALIAGDPRSFEIELVFCRMTSICQAISCSSKLLNASSSAIQARGRLRSGSKHRSHRASRCRRWATRNAARSTPGELSVRQRCNGQRGSGSFSQSASLATKSACADQITPSSMVR